MTTEERFLQDFPGYRNEKLDVLRVREFPELGVQTYMDWTGSALPPKSLLRKHFEFLESNLLGNPHSCHAPSEFAMQEIEATRGAVLRFFRADPDEYDVVFTPNATEAILLLQHYQFDSGEFLLTADNHNSVHGLREIVKQKGGVVRYAPISEDLQISEGVLEDMLHSPVTGQNKLFAFPAKSNYTGNIHPLGWVGIAHDLGWDVLLDAAAFVSNRRLDIDLFKPDFVPVSFYKMFGYPTGVGCLIIKKEKYGKLHKQWFSGGSILLVSVKGDSFIPELVRNIRYEDGTTNFMNIPAVRSGLEFLESLGDTSLRAEAIGSWLYDEFGGMHEGGSSVVLYNTRGNDIVTFGVKRNGQMIDSWEFEQAATEQGIHVRTGCFCNPGVNEELFDYDVDGIQKAYSSDEISENAGIRDLRELLSDQPVGAVRASFGYANVFEDALRLVEFTKQFLGISE